MWIGTHAVTGRFAEVQSERRQAGAWPERPGAQGAESGRYRFSSHAAPGSLAGRCQATSSSAASAARARCASAALALSSRHTSGVGQLDGGRGDRPEDHPVEAQVPAHRLDDEAGADAGGDEADQGLEVHGLLDDPGPEAGALARLGDAVMGVGLERAREHHERVGGEVGEADSRLMGEAVPGREGDDEVLAAERNDPQTGERPRG